MKKGAGQGGSVRDDLQPAQPRGGYRDDSQRGGHPKKGKLIW